jgi:hypothetical protein
VRNGTGKARHGSIQVQSGHQPASDRDYCFLKRTLLWQPGSSPRKSDRRSRTEVLDTTVSTIYRFATLKKTQSEHFMIGLGVVASSVPVAGTSFVRRRIASINSGVCSGKRTTRHGPRFGILSTLNERVNQLSSVKAEPNCTPGFQEVEA